MKLLHTLACLASFSTSLAFAQTNLSEALERNHALQAKAAATAVDYNALDYGLYWFRDQTEASKAVGQANSYFDPTRPTVIYIHGWQKGATQARNRETFVRSQAQTTTDLTSAWKQAGWNVGLCYWNQFADEDEVKDAEAKVWVANGPRAMRWRNASGNYSNGPALSAGTLCANSIANAMRGYRGTHLRLVGHSLGSQMVINVAQQLSDAVDRSELPVAVRPARVALLDPAFLKDARSYLNNRWPGEVARGVVSYLKTRNVIFEAYRSSGASSNGFIGDDNYGLLKMTAFSELVSSYYQLWQFGEKHEMAVWWYFWSFAFTGPTVVRDAGLPPISPFDVMARAPSAGTEDYRIRAQMGSTLRFLHEAGKNTRTPQDDSFKLANK